MGILTAAQAMEEISRDGVIPATAPKAMLLLIKVLRETLMVSSFPVLYASMSFDSIDDRRFGL
jgi:hypothetical protein